MFEESVWPMLEAIRKADELIAMQERVVFGRVQPVWKLKLY
jgi:hypothetical protein